MYASPTSASAAPAGISPAGLSMLQQQQLQAAQAHFSNLGPPAMMTGSNGSAGPGTARMAAQASLGLGQHPLGHHPPDIRINTQFTSPQQQQQQQQSRPLSAGVPPSPASAHAHIGSMPPPSPMSARASPFGPGTGMQPPPTPQRPPFVQQSLSFHGPSDIGHNPNDGRPIDSPIGAGPNSAPASAGYMAPPQPYRQSTNGVPVAMSPSPGPPPPMMPPLPPPQPPSAASIAARAMPPPQSTGIRNEAVLGAQLAAAGAGPITASPAGVGPGLARLSAFSEALTVALEVSTLDALRAVVHNFFTETAVLKYGLFDPAAQLNKVFEVPCAAYPRFQHIGSLCGVVSTSVSPHYVREFILTVPHPQHGRPVHVGYLLRADEAVWQSKYSDGSKVDLIGTLTCHFVLTNSPGAGIGGGPVNSPPLRIESMDFDSRSHEEYINRASVVTETVEKLYDLPGFNGNVAIKDDEDDSVSISGSGRKQRKTSGSGGVLTRRRSGAGKPDSDDHMDDPTRGYRLPKSGKSLPQSRPPGIGSEQFVKLVRAPDSKIGSFGITEMGMRCLEIAESVAQLHELIGFSLDNDLGPIQSLARYSEIYRATTMREASSYAAMPSPRGPPPQPLQPAQQPPPTWAQNQGHWPSSPHNANMSTPNLPSATIAQTSQHPSHNSFYASSTVPPPPSSSSGMPPLPPLTIGDMAQATLDQRRQMAASMSMNSNAIVDMTGSDFVNGGSMNAGEQKTPLNENDSKARGGQKGAARGR
ncbi:hypothetical protein OIO90_002368 [Microbotryomycetes sp. JL221]|nr:hypothetical protein OIO90_002368 [Microbotryomycetes sp. JL221]